MDKESRQQRLQEIPLKLGERLDDLQRNDLRIIQDPARFCFGMDAVLLSGFASAPEGGRCLDLGTGTGIIPLLMSAKTKAAFLGGLEIQPESADMAARSVALNGLEERIRITVGDIKEAGSLFDAASFDVITCNPPYMIAQHGLQNPESPKAIARHEILCSFEDVARESAKLLKQNGKLYIVHRPFRLAELIRTLQDHKLEPKRMTLVYPFVDHEPSMVLLEAVKGGRSRLNIEKPLIIYKGLSRDSKGGKPEYTEEIYDIYGY